ncbi:MAG: hypothetical protein WCS70_06775 [Verrucomicrobiota bacterium]
MADTDATLLAGKGDTNTAGGKPEGQAAAGTVVPDAAAQAAAAEKAAADQVAADKAAADAAAASPDAKAAAEKAAAEKLAADEKAKADAIPEKYEFKLPEGVKLDETLNGKFAAQAKELGLNQAKAQKLVDLYVEQQGSLATAQEQHLATMRDGWRKELLADPKSAELLGEAKKALSLASTEEKALFEGTWLGDHPAAVRFLAKVGRLLKEAPVIEGNATGKGSSVSVAKSLYPNQN